MTVIAKLMVRSLTDFGVGTFVELGCVADNDMMAAYAETEEDKLFSRYSPWGEIRLNQRIGWSVFLKDDNHVQPPGYKAFYAVMISADEIEGEATFNQSSAFVKINCYSKAKFAQDGSRVELREVYGWKTISEEGDDRGSYRRSRKSVIEKLSWKMHVDNPPAEDQFVPGKDYWLVFYDATQFTRDTAIAAAHAD